MMSQDWIRVTGRSGAWRAVNIGIAAVLFAALAGCANLPGLGPPSDIYDLTPKSTFQADLPKVAWQLVIEEPQAPGALDTTRIALKPNPLEVKYFAESRWAERAPKMVQSLMVVSFENSGKIVAVGRQAVGLRADYVLRSELRQFQAEYNGTDKLPTIRVRLNVKLIREPREEIIASKTFEERMAVTADGIQPVVTAFDEALNKVMRHVVEWTLMTPPPKVAATPQG